MKSKKWERRRRKHGTFVLIMPSGSKTKVKVPWDVFQYYMDQPDPEKAVMNTIRRAAGMPLLA